MPETTATPAAARQERFALVRRYVAERLFLKPEMVELHSRLIDDLWANPQRVPEAQAVLATLKRLLRDTYPPGRPLPLLERQKIAERSTRAIYIHSHMDEENFDVARVMKCCVGVPETDGSNIPTCSYNVLYREKDQRFADPDMLRRMERTRPGMSLPLV
jgi:hypothetical protein